MTNSDETEKEDDYSAMRLRQHEENEVDEETSSESGRTARESSQYSPGIKKLQDELEMERRKNDDLVKQMKYLQADIVNLQRQSDRMLVDVRNQARYSLILELISVKEDLARAMDAVDSPSNSKENLIDGLKLLEAKIDTSLRAEDVSTISVEIGSKLDPRLHEAVSSRITDDCEEGTILSVIGQGYMITGKVVKPALVEVARKDRKTSPAPDIEGDAIQADATSLESGNT
jgi:molecular chaperone GrpE